jgi:hypothetical protein
MSQVMPSTKRLNSVCHSIAHHAVSALSYVHPHLLIACRGAGLKRLAVELLEADPCPARFQHIAPLKLSLGALRSKFEDILRAEGFSLSEVSRACLTFRPDLQQNDDYCSICRAVLISRTGRTYEHEVDWLGQSR